MNLDAVLEHLSRDPHADYDVAEVALRLASDEHPELDVEAYLNEIAGLAHEAKPFVRGDFSVRVHGVCRYLFHELGFRGNRKEYYDPANSYLNLVLDRRKGIPITLSALVIGVGRRLGLTVHGVGLPGHFIVKFVEEDQTILIDPFHGGRRLLPVDCENLVRQVSGLPFEAVPDNLSATPLGLMIQRMLNNLRIIYVDQKDTPRTLRILTRLHQLNPDDVIVRRDLGLCHSVLGGPGKSIDHLRAYLQAAPEADDVKVIEQTLQKALQEVAKWN